MPNCKGCGKEITTFSELYKHEAACIKPDPKLLPPPEPEVDPRIAALYDLSVAILDVGTHTTKLGHTHYNPSYTEPTIISAHKNDDENFLTGDKALEFNKTVPGVIAPMKRGKVVDWKLFENYLENIFREDHYEVEGENVVFYAVPPHWSIEEISKLAEMLFESKFAYALGLVYTPVAVSEAYSVNPDNLLVEIGHSYSYCARVKSRVITSVQMLSVGIQDIYDLLAVKLGDHKFSSDFVYSYDMRETFQQLQVSLTDSDANDPYTSACTEVLFPENPKRSEAPCVEPGKAYPEFLITEEALSLVELVSNQVAQLPPEQTQVRIHVAGKLKNTKNLNERLALELNKLWPDKHFNIYGQPNYFEVWCGANLLYTGSATPKDLLLKDNFVKGDTQSILNLLQRNFYG